MRRMSSKILVLELVSLLAIAAALLISVTSGASSIFPAAVRWTLLVLALIFAAVITFEMFRRRRVQG